MGTPQVAPRIKPAKLAGDVIRQHVELVAFLWGQRDRLLDADPPEIDAAEGIRERLEIHLDALRIASRAAWPFVIDQWASFQEKGELFAYAWLAIELEDAMRLDEAIAVLRSEEQAAKGFVGALEHHRPERIAPWVRQWTSHPDSIRRRLAAHAFELHGISPGETLLQFLNDSDAETRCIALRLTAKFRQSKYIKPVVVMLDNDDASVRFWAAAALAELGLTEIAQPHLKAAAMSDEPHALVAMRTLIRTGKKSEILPWLGSLMRSGNVMAVRAVGMLEDKRSLHWLIQRMREPPLAVAAGAAFLELFPGASREDDLFTIDPAEAGPNFATRFEYGEQKIPLADNVAAWARTAGVLN